MSEFILIRGGQAVELPPGFARRAIVGDKFLTAAAQVIFPEAEDVWTLGLDGGFDGLFTDTQRLLHDGHAFAGTLLCEVLRRLFDEADSVALWYAGYADNLDSVSSPEKALAMVENGVRDDGAECYLLFRRCEF